MRARVLKIDGEQVLLGVYYQGTWWRVAARTRIPLALMSWIEGELVFSEDGQEVHFQISPDAVPSLDSEPMDEHPGLDLQV